MPVWVIEVQYPAPAKPWRLWDAKHTEKEAYECAENTERNTGWNVRVLKYVPEKG